MAKSELDAAVAAGNTQGRSVMGDAGRLFTSPSASPVSGTQEPRHNTQAGDPTASGTRVSRPNVSYAGETKGAAYSIKSSYAPQTSPEAGMTQANGRIISPSVIRSKDSFSEGIGTSY